MKLYISLVLFASIVILKSEDTPCGHHEKRTCECVCEKSCETLDILIKCLCVNKCQCVCVDGYVRDNRNGHCIPIDKCPTCAVNETYKAEGIDCQTCTNYQVVKCALQHERKCYCLPGYVRDEETGFCKEPADCPMPFPMSTIVFIWVTVVGIFQLANYVDCNNSNNVQKCGQALIKELSLVCNGVYYRPPNGRRFIENTWSQEIDDYSGASNSLSDLFKQLSNDAADLPTYRISRQLTEECCESPCSYDTLRLYCGR